MPGDACVAALAQQEAVAGLRNKLPDITGMRRNPPKLEIRMGIAPGETVVGTIGSESSRSYTVLGDTGTWRVAARKHQQVLPQFVYHKRRHLPG